MVWRVSCLFAASPVRTRGSSAKALPVLVSLFSSIRNLRASERFGLQPRGIVAGWELVASACRLIQLSVYRP